MPANLFDTAISYRAAGRDVVPDHPISKYPVGIPNWEKKIFTDSELQEYIIGKGWGIGIRNQEGLDFDNHGEPSATSMLENWKQLVNAVSPGLTDKLLIETTQHGGFHVAWKCEVIEGNQVLASRLPTKEELTENPNYKTITLVETRGLGGQFVVSPTPGYTLIQGDWCNLPVFTPEERILLIQAAKSLNQIPIGTVDYKVAGERYDKERPGDIYNREGVDETLDLLKQSGWDEIYEKGNSVYLKRPGKDSGVSATYGHVAPGIFYNFSSNGSPFEAGKAYTPFTVLSLLKFDGNYSAAASFLAEKYGIKHSQSSPSPVKISWPRPMSQEAFIGIAGEVVKTIEPHSEADPVALLMNFLTGFGSIIGDQAYYKIEADKHPMRLFSVLVGESSRGRKGTSWGYIRQLLISLDPTWEGRVISGGLSSGEGLIWAVRDVIIKRSPVKEKGHITGYEKVIEDPGISDKRLLVVESELASTLRVLGREGNILSPLIRNAWDSGNLQTLTKNSPAKATGAHISIIGHITTQELLKYLTSTETSNGFGNRFMWICVRRSKHLPHGGGPVDLGILAYKLSSIYDFAKATQEITWNSEADRIWEKIYDDLTEEEPGLVGSMTARSEAYVIRLACIYALLDKTTKIQISHLKAAIAVWDYVRNSTEFIFQGKSGDSLGNRIIEALTHKPEGMTRTDLYDYFGKNRTSEEISTSLEILEKIGRIKCEGISPEGRTKSLFTLNTYECAGKNYLEKLNKYIAEAGLDTTKLADDVNNVNNKPAEWVCPKCGSSKLVTMETSSKARVQVCADCPAPKYLTPVTEMQETLI